MHNGIIDNAASIRAELTAAGVVPLSDTDSEVLAHLVAGSDAETQEARVAERRRGSTAPTGSPSLTSASPIDRGRA